MFANQISQIDDTARKDFAACVTRIETAISEGFQALREANRRELDVLEGGDLATARLYIARRCLRLREARTLYEDLIAAAETAAGGRALETAVEPIKFKD